MSKKVFRPSLIHRVGSTMFYRLVNQYRIIKSVQRSYATVKQVPRDLREIYEKYLTQHKLLDWQDQQSVSMHAKKLENYNRRELAEHAKRN